MARSPEEQALKEHFEALYVTAQAPVKRAVGRSVCGCDYDGTGYTVDEARALGPLLAIGLGSRLLEVGAGPSTGAGTSPRNSSNRAGGS
ncbi:MAG: hypothetical protein O7A03_01420 [Alphaproteobacteria bacterium]|nr:hypothetical protein [Alphaproteobacteria bacterium]